MLLHDTRLLSDSVRMGNSITWRDAVGDAIVELLEQHRDIHPPQIQFLAADRQTGSSC